jgi:hypothetical protein
MANVVSMPPTSCSARLFLCARCRTQVLLCRGCDRGQQYCSRACSGQARRERRREAAERYQESPRGRQLHAERSRRWRARQAAASTSTKALQSEDAGGVTHQGCPAPIASASSTTVTMTAVFAYVRPLQWRCNRCHQGLAPHVRQGFLRRARGRDGPP